MPGSSNRATETNVNGASRKVEKEIEKMIGFWQVNTTSPNRAVRGKRHTCTTGKRVRSSSTLEKAGGKKRRVTSKEKELGKKGSERKEMARRKERRREAGGEIKKSWWNEMFDSRYVGQSKK